jgi:hypothetical protein
LIVVLSIVIGSVLNQFLYPEPDHLPWVYAIWPIFLFDRAVYILYDKCSAYQCMDLSEFLLGSELLWICLTLILEAIVFMAITLYIDRILPKQYGVSEHPLLCLAPKLPCYVCACILRYDFFLKICSNLLLGF